MKRGKVCVDGEERGECVEQHAGRSAVVEEEM